MIIKIVSIAIVLVDIICIIVLSWFYPLIQEFREEAKNLIRDLFLIFDKKNQSPLQKREKNKNARKLIQKANVKLSTMYENNLIVVSICVLGISLNIAGIVALFFLYK